MTAIRTDRPEKTLDIWSAWDCWIVGFRDDVRQEPVGKFATFGEAAAAYRAARWALENV